MIDQKDKRNDDNNQESKSNYIKQEQYEKIRKCQESIFEETQISLSVKRIINELITEDNLQKIKEKFITYFVAKTLDL